MESFPGGKLPNHSSYPWRPGIESYTTLNDPDKSNVREIWNNCHTQAKIFSVQMSDKE